jgi:CheY-like chemotaxis protein
MESVGRLAGGVAHDFNNLLTVINSYAELAVAELKEGDQLREDLKEIHAAGVRAAALTRQLLAFSRKQVLQPVVLNLSTLVAGTEKMLRRMIGEDVDLAIVPAEGLGCVKADPGQIEQVIVNLAVNARDAMPAGGKLTIETADVEFDEVYASQHVGAHPGQYVMLAISDTGTGMDEATRSRIFEPFFTTKDVGLGTGLGLSTVYGIVKQSGGYIWVYSEVGVGTTFKIYLPRVAEAARDAHAVPAQTRIRGTETVLVVEDDKALRRAAKRILSTAGYAVIEAADGTEALQVMEGHEGPLHLLLTDVIMPGMSGREAAERLGALRPGLKVLFSSGYTDDSILRHGVLEQGVHFIAKPYTAAALTRKVRETLDSHD